MSSGTPWNVDEIGRQIRSGAMLPHGGKGSVQPRQAYLDHLWRFYRCANYDERGTDWNGQPTTGKIEHEQLAQGQYVPPGYYDAGGSMLPLKFRRPTAPYYLGKIVVDRFTGLLFSEKRHPKVMVEGDELTEDWVSGFIEATRLWPKMLMARTFGGAMGSVALGLLFRQGQPAIEVHDPRYSIPYFTDRSNEELKALEIRYMFPDLQRDRDGEWVEVWFWYRRVIDEQSDLVWPRVLVEDGEEPDWAMEKHYETHHRLGFCPVVWIQNKPVINEPDGDSDCHGIYDMIEAIDALIAQANRGVLANCDPTLVVASKGEMVGVAKGSDNAIKLPENGNASYLEIEGAGPKAAMEMADMLEDKALKVARCVLDDTGSGERGGNRQSMRTATEIERRYAGMLEQADIFREQYGEMGVKKILEMAIRAARVLGESRVERREGQPAQIVREVIELPPKMVDQPDGSVRFEARALGPSDRVVLKWPPYFEPTIDDAQKAVAAAGAAKQFGLVDLEHAVQFIASHFQIEDPQAVMEKIGEMDEEFAKQLEGQVMGRLNSSPGGGTPFSPGGG